MAKEITKTMFFTSGVTYRVHQYSDGTLSSPEILKKWTSETYAPRKKAQTQQKSLVSEEIQEEWIE